eukprot:6197446-Pleurochrysis_carterae.AAC.1
MVHVGGHTLGASYIRYLPLTRYYLDSITPWLTISVRALGACPFAHHARCVASRSASIETPTHRPRGCAEGRCIDMTDRQMADVPRDGATWG